MKLIRLKSYQKKSLHLHVLTKKYCRKHFHEYLSGTYYFIAFYTVYLHEIEIN